MNKTRTPWEICNFAHYVKSYSVGLCFEILILRKNECYYNSLLCPPLPEAFWKVTISAFLANFEPFFLSCLLAVPVRQKFVIHLLLSFFQRVMWLVFVRTFLVAWIYIKGKLFWHKHLYSEYNNNMIITPCFITISTYTHIKLISRRTMTFRLWIQSKSFL